MQRMHTTSFMIRMHAKASHVTAVSGCEVGGGEVCLDSFLRGSNPEETHARTWLALLLLATQNPSCADNQNLDHQLTSKLVRLVQSANESGCTTCRTSVTCNSTRAESFSVLLRTFLRARVWFTTRLLCTSSTYAMSSSFWRKSWKRPHRPSLDSQRLARSGN